MTARLTPLAIRAPVVEPGPSRLVAGHAPELKLDPLSVPRVRLLNAGVVRRKLGPPLMPRDGQVGLLQAITDLSGSMWGGNDAAGLRHEALLILAEHLACLARGQDVPWHLQVISFDTDTHFDLGPVPLDRRQVKKLAPHLLAPEYGGSSCLGPGLGIAEATRWPGLVARCVLSDFELFDQDVPTVLRRMTRTPAAARVAVVFRSPVPAAFDTPTTIVRHVDPSTDEADVVACFLWDAVRSLAGDDVAHREAPVRDAQA